MIFSLMNEEDARTVSSWRYEGQYAAYNASDDTDITEMLDRRSPYYAVRDEHSELIGFFSFGTSAIVWDSAEPGIYIENKMLAIGLGMRPDLTGKGHGRAFVEAGLAFAQQVFAPDHFQLFVYSWNERAIRLYERAGFQRVRAFVQKNSYGENEFLEMRKNT